MSVEVDGTTIVTYVGDTCTVVFTDLEEDMVIYLGVRDKKTNKPIFDEIKTVVNSAGEAIFTIPPELTNKFEIKPPQVMTMYNYGIKVVDEETGEENTILLGENPKFGDTYTLKAYLKKVEGLEE